MKKITLVALLGFLFDPVSSAFGPSSAAQSSQKKVAQNQKVVSSKKVEEDSPFDVSGLGGGL